MQGVGSVQLHRKGKEWTIPVVPGLFWAQLIDELFPGDEVDLTGLGVPCLDVMYTKPRRIVREPYRDFAATTPLAPEFVRLDVNTECHTCHRVAAHRIVVGDDGLRRRCALKRCNGEWTVQ
ncbi:hypothetical protein J4U01_gp074 [Mycobacterium phage Kumao]|uniref:Uncharacterized protein n=1 Tax=Mycobacterium phage Kumao TaxID=2041344 RepID=A0A2D1GPU0_9CAUD|nr:hypothetical protein J4U01_gp074 [Mycobacterium phage Kumao]ATN94037.1 hypothetical protein SEA_KUMAO_74 [Mycobacterium phage Kumao]